MALPAVSAAIAQSFAPPPPHVPLYGSLCRSAPITAGSSAYRAASIFQSATQPACVYWLLYQRPFSDVPAPELLR